MKLSSIVPWGRSLAEYRDMFALSEADLRTRILGCGDGPASFNAEAKALGATVVSADPIYAFTAHEIDARVRETYESVISQTRETAERYVWRRFADIDALAAARLAAMQAFLVDYDTGRAAGRYVAAALPDLPFGDGVFELALVSHFLFLYSDHVPRTGHVAGALELLRVAREVRIFPLLTLDGDRSPHVQAVREAAAAVGCCTAETPVPYEFQRGGDHMLRLWRAD